MRHILFATLGWLPIVAAAAPVTVTEHTLDVRLDRSGLGTAQQTWTVRIDDPAACAAGVLAPPGLHGAEDGEARVLQSVLLIPDNAIEGSTYTLTSRRRVSRWDSGVFALAPDALTESATLTVQSSGRSAPLVWADDDALLSISSSPNAKTVTTQWRYAESGTALWSTETSWASLGERLESQVSEKLASRAELGRELVSASRNTGLGIGGLMDEVRSRVSVQPGNIGTLDDARTAGEALTARTGTATERALVLLSVLRESDYDARLAWVRPQSGTGISPIPPVPSAYPLPAIAVMTDQRTLWLDPASDFSVSQGIPAAFTGGIGWVSGRSPEQILGAPSTTSDVTIIGSAILSSTGSLAWDVSVTASGAIQERLRSELAPLSEEQRKQTFQDLLTVARSSGETRSTVRFSNLTRSEQPLRIELQMVEPSAFHPAGPGMEGSIVAALAPALSEWLGDDTRITEDIGIVLPSNLRALGMPAQRSVNDALGTIARSVVDDGPAIRLHTEVSRNFGLQTDETERFFRRAAEAPLQLLLLPPITRKLAKSMAKTPWLDDTADQQALSVIATVRAGDIGRARKLVLKNQVGVDRDTLVWRVAERSDSSDHRALDVLWDLSETDDQRITVAQALASCCGQRASWLRFSKLLRTPNPADRLEVVLAVVHTQPPAQPDPITDPTGNQAWFPPELLMEWAIESAAASPTTPEDGDARILRLQAQAALKESDPETAEALLIQAMRSSTAPDLPILFARAGAAMGVNVHETILTVEEAVDKAPADPVVLLAAADVTLDVGHTEQALAYRLKAARLIGDDTRLWLQVSREALAVADLGTALHAARRASDLSPNTGPASEQLATLAWLAGDLPLAGVAAYRVGAPPRAPLVLADTLSGTTVVERAAILEWRDTAVRLNPDLLADRALARLARGDVDKAALDGLWLSTVHNDPRGASLTLAATTSRMTETQLGPDTTDVSATVTLTRGIVLGTPGLDRAATMLEDNAVASAVREWNQSANTMSEAGGFTATSTPTVRAPSGYTRHSVLADADGVVGWTLPGQGRAIVVVRGGEYALPPLLSSITQRVLPAERRMQGGVVERLRGLAMPVYA
ncbi:MAG: hypothetical protein ACI855_001168, partial [Myxococcota bacterium]